VRAGGVQHTIGKILTRVTTLLQTSSRSESERGVIISQNGGSLNLGSFGIPPWESRDKMPVGCERYGEVQRILYGGRWWLPPSPGHGEYCESEVARGLF
jgi:hypothetical protein